MEPRELWERNTVLAEAFCASDEQVRQVQSALDEAQANRTRTLAAFAVTVGNDGTVADMMGLHEREVRLARRTVGKDDARTVAEALLAPAPQTPPEPSPDPAPPVAEAPPSAASYARPAAETIPPEPPPAPPPQAAQAPQQPGFATSQPAFSTPPPEEPVTWSPAMDSVLLWSWQSGIDLQAVATELGLNMRALLLRVQTLAAEGLLTLKTPPSDPGQAGRHRRRRTDDFYVTAPDSPESLYAYVGGHG